MNKIISSFVGVIVAVVLFASILLPVISDAEYSTSDKQDYTNPNVAGYALDYTTTANLTVTTTGTTGEETIVCNGITVERAVPNMNTVLVAGDTFEIDLAASNTDFSIVARTASGLNFDSTLTSGESSVVCANGVCTITLKALDDPIVVNYTWLMSTTANGPYITQGGHLQNTYFEDKKDMITLGYATNQFISYRDGVVTTSGATPLTASYTSDHVDGTRDLNKTSSSGVTITDGTNNYTLGTSIVLKTISAPMEGGTIPTLLAVVPIMVIVGLVVFAVSLIRSRGE